MIPKKIPGVPDIEDMQKWWNMKEKVAEFYRAIANNWTINFNEVKKTLIEIEALEPKKEGE